MSLTTRLSALALVAFVALSAAGCDSADPTGAAATGPTVQFGTTSLTAPEGEMAQIPVTLRGAQSGQTVSVDVLFGAGASTACPEEGTRSCAPVAGDTTIVDFIGFGQPAANGNRVQSVTLTAGDDGTATTTIPVFVRADGLIEAAETAVFALQNVSAGASIGTPSQISLIIGTLPIATIRAFPDNAAATVEGLVTRVAGRFVWIQDDTAGIVLYGGPAGTAFTDAIARGEIKRGDRLQASGKIDIYNELVELTFIEDFEVITVNEGVPAPKVVTLAQLAANLTKYQSLLVRVPNLTIQTTDIVFDAGTSGRNYSVTDPSGTAFQLRVSPPPNSDAAGTPVPQGPTTFTGVLGQFRADGQLTLVNRTDLNP